MSSVEFCSILLWIYMYIFLSAIIFSEHWNYFGMDDSLGPVAVSLRREKLEEDKEHGQQYNYRIIFRTSEVSLLPLCASALPV